ncbi:MAG: AAA family ATPase [bacterium]|nr:AAA family ATPase [bacterium]
MLKRLEIVGFKSFAKKTVLDFLSATTAIVGPNGSGKSNVAEAFRFALGEQSMKSMRGRRTEDLIFNGSHSVPRANRAAVAIVFDNRSRGEHRPFRIDFDEVVIERAVLRDGTSEYSINGSKVRLRDIEELLAGANIGETGHHIISQGEADRILLASPRDRRAMLEDALGLKVYEFKKQEAQKKLVRTEDNIMQVNSLRRELAPHLRFLESQVKKLERADELRKELTSLAQTYFAIEDAYLSVEKGKAAEGKRDSAERLAVTSVELANIEEQATTDVEGAKHLEFVRKTEREIERINSERSTLARSIGRVEGALSVATDRSTRVAQESYVKVPREDLSGLVKEVEKQAAEATTPEAVLAAFTAIRQVIVAFVNRFVVSAEDTRFEEEHAIQTLQNERAELLANESVLSGELEQAKSELAQHREALTAHDETGRDLRRLILDLAQAKAHEEGMVARSEAREHELALLAEALEREKVEILVLVGVAAVSYEPLSPTDGAVNDRSAHEARKRTLERTKIRLEEAGGTGEDIRQEHKEVSTREAFLATELEDLARSAEGLRALIGDLDTELAKYFSEGLAKVNASFGEYFALMFDGGNARLVLEELEAPEEGALLESEEENNEKTKERSGIEISVSLPKKKVRSLMQLSGGERALTSIALIFAMSQVNPPPFLILDETDAALDEANSRRYGDMIENLAKQSQLIVITHNRETMSRANTLYGVTMGGDGVSRLLSVKFDEAIAVAK